MYFRYRVKRKHHIFYFYNAVVEYYRCTKCCVKHKFHQVQKKKITGYVMLQAMQQMLSQFIDPMNSGLNTHVAYREAKSQ